MIQKNIFHYSLALKYAVRSESLIANVNPKSQFQSSQFLIHREKVFNASSNIYTYAMPVFVHISFRKLFKYAKRSGPSSQT